MYRWMINPMYGLIMAKSVARIATTGHKISVRNDTLVLRHAICFYLLQRGVSYNEKMISRQNTAEQGDQLCASVSFGGCWCWWPVCWLHVPLLGFRSRPQPSQKSTQRQLLYPQAPRCRLPIFFLSR